MMNKDMPDSIRFLYWLATAETVMNLGEDLKDDDLMGQMGFLFEDKSYISILVEENGSLTLWTICGREEFSDSNFARVAQFLWDNHARDN